MPYPIFSRYLVNENGVKLSNATVTVTNESDGLPSVFYSDRDGLFQVPNPFITGETGECTFFIAPGEYRIQANDGISSIDFRYVLVSPNTIGVSGDILGTTVLTNTSPAYNRCVGISSFTITLPDVSTCIGLSFTFFRQDPSTANIITINCFGSDSMEGRTSLTLSNRYSILTVVSDGFTWYIKEYIDRKKFNPTLIGSTNPGVHAYGLNNSGTYTRIKHLVFANVRLEVTTKDALMSGDVRIGGFPFNYYNDGIDTIAVANAALSSYTNINQTGDTQLGVSLVLGNNYAVLRESADNLPFAAINSTQVSSGLVINFFIVYNVLN